MTQLLINHKADINSKDQLGRTALYFAYREGFNDIGRLLLLNKAVPWSNK